MWVIFLDKRFESSHMCHNALLDDKFYEFLVRIDQDLAAQTQAGRCRRCGSALHRNRYQRKPRSGGATLIRPGLEKVRDLAADRQIDAVLVYSPDRLSRKYAYQVLLLEELARNDVRTLFVKAPQTTTPEDQLLVQFQGMIAEYERAQILERSRRG